MDVARLVVFNGVVGVRGSVVSGWTRDRWSRFATRGRLAGLSRVALAGVLCSGGLLGGVPAVASAFAGLNGKIFFQRDQNGIGVIYSINADGSALQQITNPAAGDSDSTPQSSPDGRKVVFLRSGPSLRGDAGDVWIVRADGSGSPLQLTNTGADQNSWAFDPSFSPDGQQVVYEVYTEATNSTDVWIVNADGSGSPLQLTSTGTGSSPSFSPDGGSILYTFDCSPYPCGAGLYEMDLTGANKHQLVARTQYPAQPNGPYLPLLSPDGQQLAFLNSEFLTGPDLYLAAANGTGATLRYTGPSRNSSISNPMWAPDSGSLVLSDSSGIVRIPTAAGAAQTIVPNTTSTFYSNPSYSPDGTELVFWGGPRSGGSLSRPLYISAADGSGLVQIPGTGGSGIEDVEADWAIAPSTVSIGAGQPVPEPASGSVPESFTISLPAASVTDTTIHYKTLDGTGPGAATVAANAYTAIPDGQVTIPAGETSARVQVQVDDGSGQASTMTESYRVMLTSSSGAPIGTAIATGVILIAGVAGKLSDQSGAAQAGHGVSLSGMAASGQSVSQRVLTDGGGRYQLYADPGTYTLTPDPPSQSAASYEPVGCPGTTQLGACTNFTLASGTNLSVDFKLATVVVNSIADDGDPPASLDAGVCDTTPSQPSSTCTLRAAVELLNKLGSGTITFDIPGGGVPTIQMTQGATPITVDAPIVIDAGTQPGSRQVALTRAANVNLEIGVAIDVGGVTLRGMKIFGFPTSDVRLSGNDTLVQNELDPVSGLPAGSSKPPAYVAAVAENGGSGHNVIQGNTIGNGKTASTFAVPLLLLGGIADTVGGAQPGQGNVIDGPGGAEIDGARSVIQGNQFAHDAGLQVLDNETVGGATSVPGTGVGNDIGGGGGVAAGSGDVIQGNHIHDSYSGISLRDHDTVGGASPTMGNLIEQNPGLNQYDAGIQIGQAPDGKGSDNVIEHNTIINNGNAGGVVIYGGAGNQVFNNVMDGNSVAINLGGGPHRYNTLSFFDSGPNHYQPYPELLNVSNQHGTVTVTAQLSTGLRHRHDSYTIDLYAQAEVCQDSITEGQADGWLGNVRVSTDGTGTARFTLSASLAQAQNISGAFDEVPAFSLTATAADGSTSELSPCLMLGQKAASFTGSGVTPTSHTLTVTTSPGPARDARDAAARKSKAKRARIALALFCPPRTTRYCAGSFVLRRSGRHGSVIARGKFKLAPGQVATIDRTLPSGVLAQLEHHHRLRARLTITARDRAKHPHHKRTTAKITLLYKPGSR